MTCWRPATEPSSTSGPQTILWRSTDITCGGQFPKADGTFAKRPDGCSSVTDNPKQVPDKLGSANFGAVCDDHDRCYYTIGANVDDCNNNFCDRLQRACRKAYCPRIFPCDANPFYRPCTEFAQLYCDAVRLVAAETYKAAQDLQKRYETCIAENGGITPPPPRCSNGEPEGASWHETQPGSRCNIVTYVCRDAEIIMTGVYTRHPCPYHEL